MNFCGVDHRTDFDVESAPHTDSAVVTDSFQCVGCMKGVEEDDDIADVHHVLSPVSSDSSENDEKDSSLCPTKKDLEPVRMALDNIQQTIEENTYDSHAINDIVNVDNAYDGTESTLSRDHLENSSPCLLNPLVSGQWAETADGVEIMGPELLCPILDVVTPTSPSQEALIQRLEQGFQVRPMNCANLFVRNIGAIGGAAASSDEFVSLYLHRDRSRLCFNSTENYASGSGSFQKENGWIQIPITNILRLEIGGENAKMFSIVTEKDNDGLVYFSFEATCVIDREVVVSTLMLLLDGHHNKIQPENEDNNTLGWIEKGGTMDKPIPCSPSLDEPSGYSDMFSFSEHPIVCSPSLETERVQNSFQLSPKQRQLFVVNSSDNIHSESGRVIHLEDVSISDSTLSRVLGEWSRRASSSVCLQQKSMECSDEVDDVVRLDCKPSASSTQIGINTNNSTNLAPTVWCSGDTCSLALNDIAETCTSIFALRHNESLCSPSLDAEQRVAVEEFIATALGTSNVVYSYLTDGDVWSNKLSLPATDAKENKITRNRAALLNAQAARLRSLKNEMTFAAALKQSKEKMRFVQTVQSFDDAYNREAGTKKLRAATEAANLLHGSALLRSITQSMKMHGPEGLPEDDVAYYDSDPEDLRPRHRNQGPRKVAADRQQQDLDHTPIVDRPTAWSGIGMEDCTAAKISKKLDEGTIVEMVQVRHNDRPWLVAVA
jgi:hypothetical protein